MSNRSTSNRTTIVRTLHDVGLATWFGGSLMGAVGLNGATAAARDPQERLRLSSLGWARWTPVQITAIAAHATGGAALILANRRRLEHQQGAGANTVVKLALTVAAAAASAYSGWLGRTVGRHADEPTDGATEPAAGASSQLKSAQQQLKVLQWAIPALTGVALALGAQQGEQQQEAAAVDPSLVPAGAGLWSRLRRVRAA